MIFSCWSLAFFLASRRAALFLAIISGVSEVVGGALRALLLSHGVAAHVVVLVTGNVFSVLVFWVTLILFHHFERRFVLSISVALSMVFVASSATKRLQNIAIHQAHTFANFTIPSIII